MILLALLAQAAMPAPAPSPALDSDVVVIARKLGTWRGRIRTNPLGTTCVTTQPTGDGEIDAIGCAAMERCWPEMLPRLKAAQVKGVPAADSKRLVEEATRAFTACGKPQREAMIDALHARRVAAREQGA